MILLEAISGGSHHGYEIIKALDERTHGQYSPSPGAVYPTLQYLEDLGYVRATVEGDRRVYELTDAGRAELNTRAEKIQAFWADFAASAPSEGSQLEISFLKDELEDLSRTVWKGLQDAISRGERETIRAVRLKIEQCQNDIRSLVSGGDTSSTPTGEKVSE